MPFVITKDYLEGNKQPNTSLVIDDINGHLTVKPDLVSMNTMFKVDVIVRFSECK